MIPNLDRAQMRRLSQLLKSGTGGLSSGQPDDPPDATRVYVVRVEETPIPAATTEGETTTPGHLDLPVYRITADGELQPSPMGTSRRIHNIGDVASPTQTYVLAVQERLSGKLIYVGDIDSGGGGTSWDNGGCDCNCYPRGSVTVDDVQWATTYRVTRLMEPLPIELDITYQGLDEDEHHYWQSEDLELECGDTYRLTMTVTGYLERQTTITVQLVDGGGSGGALLCCDGEEFAWTFWNPQPIDPLCSMLFGRDPTGFVNRGCAVGPCRLCVIPRNQSVQVECMADLREHTLDEDFCRPDEFRPCDEDDGPLVYATDEAPAILLLEGLGFASWLVSEFSLPGGATCSGGGLLETNRQASWTAILAWAATQAAEGIALEYALGEWSATIEGTVPLVHCTSGNTYAEPVRLTLEFKPCVHSGSSLSPARVGLLRVTLEDTNSPGVTGVESNGSIAWNYWLHSWGDGASDLNTVNTVTLDDTSVGIGDFGGTAWPFDVTMSQAAALVPDTLTLSPAV